MASITRTRKNELTAAEIAAVQLSNRQVHGEYVTYTALGSDGVTEYTVTLRDGDPVGCTCPATVPCKHRAAAAFEEAWSSPVAVAIGHDLAQDLSAHLDDMAEDEDEQSMADVAAEIIADEQVQAKKARKLAAQEAYRQAWPEDFSFYAGAA